MLVVHLGLIINTPIWSSTPARRVIPESRARRSKPGGGGEVGWGVQFDPENETSKQKKHKFNISFPFLPYISLFCVVGWEV